MSIIDESIEQFTEATVTELTKIIQSSNNALMVSAARFKRNYLEVKDQIVKIEEIAQRMQNIRHSARESSTTLPKEYERLAQSRQQLMNAAWWEKVQHNMEQFQIELNAMLDQKIATVYVTTSGRGKNKKVHIYELPQGEFIKPGISSTNRLVGRYVASLQSLRSKAIERFPDKDRNIEILSNTYLLALSRYEQLKARKISGFYWKEWNKKSPYGMVTVSNKGDIGEAFLHAALGKRKILMGKNMEGNLKRFAKLVVQVESGSGLLFGDFTGADGIEYAAKSEGASMLGMQQMIDLAEEILSGTIYDVATLRKKQQQYLKASAPRNMIQTDLDGHIQDVIKNLLSINKKS